MVTIDSFSRGDTQEFADLSKLAKRFLRGTYNTSDGEVKEAPSLAYVQEVVEELRKGEQGECPICLEAFEDAVLTPCAHRLCRECLLASFRNATSGLCPVCRYYQAIIVLDIFYLTLKEGSSKLSSLQYFSDESWLWHMSGLQEISQQAGSNHCPY